MKQKNEETAKAPVLETANLPPVNYEANMKALESKLTNMKSGQSSQETNAQT